MKRDVIAKIFVNPQMVLLFLGLFIFLLLSTCVFPFLNPFKPSGYVIGNFRSGDHRGFGDFCGQYPFTCVVVDNYSVTGDIDDWDNTFYFGNQYTKVDCFKQGEIIKITYHQESRPSDTTSGDTIYYWVIDNIEKL